MNEDLKTKVAFALLLAALGVASGVARFGFWLANKVDA